METDKNSILLQLKAGKMPIHAHFGTLNIALGVWSVALLIDEKDVFSMGVTEPLKLKRWAACKREHLL